MRLRETHIGKIRAVSLLLALLITFGITACGKKEEAVKPAEFGDYGAKFALKLATTFPYRNAFSSGEEGAGLLIRKEFESLGYKVEEQAFQSPDGGKTSKNFIVRIPGEGFMQRDSFGQYTEVHKTVVIGAHYDSPISYSDRDTFPDYDGIQNNACGIGSLMTIAKQMVGKTYGYDVILVAFGASSSNYLGARSFLSSMKENEQKKIECMYCIESIYAGDKLYAHAGLSSLKDGKKYTYRRKLYEAYDVAYENRLSSLTGTDLYYNMSLMSFDVDGDGKEDIYREVTKVGSDYTAFDHNSIPVVFFESSDYNFSKMGDMKETKNLELQSYDGAIRNTPLDSSKILGESLDATRLQVRINVVSFIVIHAVDKGSQNCVKLSAYKEGERLAPTVAPKKKGTPAPTEDESKKG